jgi:hypothetical protein
MKGESSKHMQALGTGCCLKQEQKRNKDNKDNKDNKEIRMRLSNRTASPIDDPITSAAFPELIASSF